MRVLHIITDLGQGGAETVLFRLINATQNRFEHAVVSLHGEGVYAQPLRNMGIPTLVLGMRRGAFDAGAVRKLREFAATFRPNVVQARLDHANFFSTLIRNHIGDAPIIWAVHSTQLGAFSKTWKTRIVRKLCAWQSRAVPTAIISDAHSSVAAYANVGFAANKLRVIPNGVDADLFQPNAQKRALTRAAWGVAPNDTLLGCVARWDPAKDHENLLRALQQLVKRGVAFRCALVGNGTAANNAQLSRLIAHYQLEKYLLMVGPTHDVPAAMNAIDIHVLPSRSESLPVAVMEAMACGVPCIVTDVGDSRKLVAETGWVVPPENSSALADAIALALEQFQRGELTQRSVRCRARIIDAFSLGHMADEYADLWTNRIALHCMDK